MISLNKFAASAKNCGLPPKSIFRLYQLLRKTITLHSLNPNGSFEDRKKINREIESLLEVVKKSACKYLQNELILHMGVNDAEVIIQAHKEDLSPHKRERAMLNRRPVIYKKFLAWRKTDDDRLAEIERRLAYHHQKISNKKRWRYGILGGVTAALAIGATIYLHSSGEEKNKH